MNALHDLQRAFVGAIFDDHDTGIEHAINANGLTSNRRLQIYHNNVFISLTEALRAVYPVVNRLVGDEFFRYLAREYMQAHPSTSGDLHDFGDQFSMYIANVDTAKSLEYLPDVACLEWAYHRVFHAADTPALEISALRQVDETQYGELKFDFNSASALILSRFPILRIWQTNQPNDDTDKVERSTTLEDETISLDEGETRLLVIRRNLDIEFQSLSTGEFEFLRSLRGGMCFSQACESAMNADPDCDVAQTFQSHVHAATLTDFYF